MTQPPCDAVRTQAADLALDIVGGDERAALLGHLESCPSCRDDVRSLGTVADRLLRAVPAEEPPSGFEERVLARLADEPHPLDRGRSRLVVAGLGAAAAVLVVVLIGAALLRPGGDTREAVMVSTDGEVVGEVTLTHDPAGILVAVPGWEPVENRPYEVRVLLESGATRDLGTLQLEDGYGGHGLDRIDPGDVVRVELLRTDTGDAVCGADL